MARKLEALLQDVPVDCFGEFRPEDELCRYHCALCIRCLIDKNKNIEMDVFDEMMAADFITVRLQ